MLIWNILSLNGMRSFGVNPKTKLCELRPKADNIIQLRTSCYIMVLESHLVMLGYVILKHCMTWP
jgi:hypothetical protein